MSKISIQEFETGAKDRSEQVTKRIALYLYQHENEAFDFNELTATGLTRYAEKPEYGLPELHANEADVLIALKALMKRKQVARKSINGVYFYRWVGKPIPKVKTSKSASTKARDA